MINLIPPGAKSIIAEYWLRVLTSWFVLWSLAIFIGITTLVPTYALISYQVDGYSKSVEDASKKILDFESVSKDLAKSSQQAGTIVNGLKSKTVSEYITLFKSLENSDITFSEIVVSKTDAGFGPVVVVGEANNRQSLAALRDRLLTLSEVEAVDLPISSLAKNKDIQFSMSITIASPTTP